MNAQHTQDQWEAVEYEPGGGVAFVRIGDITVSGTYRGGDSDELRIEDARLIAAAPELLEALKDALNYAADDSTPAWPNMRQRALAAISKATGEPPGEPSAIDKAKPPLLTPSKEDQ